VFEVWDSDLLKLFSLAGLSRRTPPPFMKICDAPDTGDRSLHPPRITSPQEWVTYNVRKGIDDHIEFTAVNDGGRRSLFWFVDTELVGEGQTVFWHARPGSFTVRVVDDQGQSAEGKLVVRLIAEGSG
jgi:penicillin-binding protein 1C